MFPQVFPCPQIHPYEIATRDDYPATNYYMPAMEDDLFYFGNLAYDYLVREANGKSGQWPPDWFGYSPPPEDRYGSMVYLPPASSPAGYDASPSTTNVSLLFSPSPSPSLSQASYTSESSTSGPSTPESHQASPEPSPTPKPSCCNATPVFNHIRRKWCCSACDKPFRGKWECRRHIGITGKRAICLACGGNLSGREDSLRRHMKRYCKGDKNLRFEDNFVEVERSPQA